MAVTGTITFAGRLLATPWCTLQFALGWEEEEEEEEEDDEIADRRGDATRGGAGTR